MKKHWTRANAAARLIFAPVDRIPITPAGMHEFIQRGWIKGYEAAQRDARRDRARKGK